MNFDELLSKAHITTIKMIEQKYDNMTNGEVIESLFTNVGTNFSNIIDLNLWWNAKYKSKNEIHCNCTDEEIAKSFISDVEAVKDLLPQEPKTWRWKKMVSVYDMIEGKYRMIPYTYKDEELGNPPLYVCDCGNTSKKPTHYCPDCGAKMESEDKE